jgi:hypothetical protein
VVLLALQGAIGGIRYVATDDIKPMVTARRGTSGGDRKR